MKPPDARLQKQRASVESTPARREILQKQRASVETQHVGRRENLQKQKASVDFRRPQSPPPRDLQKHRVRVDCVRPPARPRIASTEAES